MIPGLKKRVLNLQDVIMYAAIFRKHLRLMVLVFCLTLTSALAFYMYAKPVYYSRSIVHVDALARPLDTDKIFHDSRMRAVIAQLRSPFNIEQTAAKLGVKADFRTITRDHLLKISIHINAEKDLEVEVYPRSYKWAQDWTKTMVDEFLRHREEQRIEYQRAVIDSFTKDLSEVSQKLDGTMTQRYQLEEEKGLIQSEIELGRVKELPREIIAVKQQMAARDRVRASLLNPDLTTIARLSLLNSLDKQPQINVGEVIGSTSTTTSSAGLPADDGTGGDGDAQSSTQIQVQPGVVVVPSAINAPAAWEEIEKEQRRVENEIQAASAVYLPGHRKMLALQKQLDDIEKKLQVELQVAQNRFDLEGQHLVERQQALESQLPEYRDINKQHEKTKQTFDIYKSSQVAWNKLYANMSKRISTVDFAADRERVNLEFGGIAELKPRPISPNRLHLLVAALFMGAVLAIGLPVLIEYLDHTISNFEQVEATFQIRGLGIIPQIEADDTALVNSVDAEDERTIVENFRVIRTNLLSMGTITKDPHVIMVTSAIPKEGKTVVSSNLAISFAQTGARTLLIDMDMRRGRLHRLFGLRKTPGMTNLLLGNIELENACRPTGKENLSILTAGAHTECSTEMLGSSRLDELMQTLRSRYDRIIVDTPPVLGLSETSILQRHVDGVLFVVWGGRTPLRSMKTAIETLHVNGANFYGFILNRLDLSATTNYYQYYYYSNDYYHNYHALENA